jgi:hypothetical protein
LDRVLDRVVLVLILFLGLELAASVSLEDAHKLEAIANSSEAMLKFEISLCLQFYYSLKREGIFCL